MTEGDPEPNLGFLSHHWTLMVLRDRLRSVDHLPTVTGRTRSSRSHKRLGDVVRLSWEGVGRTSGVLTAGGGP